MPVNKDDLDTGCRLHVEVAVGRNEKNFYDVGIDEFRRILSRGLPTRIVSLGKYGSYPQDFKRELNEIKKAKAGHEYLHMSKDDLKTVLAHTEE